MRSGHSLYSTYFLATMRCLNLPPLGGRLGVQKSFHGFAVGALADFKVFGFLFFAFQNNFHGLLPPVLREGFFVSRRGFLEFGDLSLAIALGAEIAGAQGENEREGKQNGTSGTTGGHGIPFQICGGDLPGQNYTFWRGWQGECRQEEQKEDQRTTQRRRDRRRKRKSSFTRWQIANRSKRGRPARRRR